MVQCSLYLDTVFPECIKAGLPHLLPIAWPYSSGPRWAKLSQARDLPADSRLGPSTPSQTAASGAGFWACWQRSRSLVFLVQEWPPWEDKAGGGGGGFISGCGRGAIPALARPNLAASAGPIKPGRLFPGAPVAPAHPPPAESICKRVLYLHVEDFGKGPLLPELPRACPRPTWPAEPPCQRAFFCPCQPPLGLCSPGPEMHHAQSHHGDQPSLCCLGMHNGWARREQWHWGRNGPSPLRWCKWMMPTPWRGWHPSGCS